MVKDAEKVISRLKQENERLQGSLADASQQAEQYKREKEMLQASYEKALTSLADSEAKQETSARELKIAHEQMTFLWKELEQLRRQIDDSSTSNRIERMLPSGVSALRVSAVDEGVRQLPPPRPSASGPSVDEMELQCTLCKEKIKANGTPKQKKSPRSRWLGRLTSLESHSKSCSTGAGTEPQQQQQQSSTATSSSALQKDKKRTSPPLPRSSSIVNHLEPLPPTPPPQEEFLVVNVTRTPPGQSDLAPFKILTRTNLPHFVKQSLEVYRSQGDFQWIYDILIDSCPERIIPPLKLQISLHATMLEFQRFLSRIGNHKSLRKNHFFVAFLQAPSDELRSLRAKNKPQRQHQQEGLFKPSQGRDTSSGSLVQTKVYLEGMEDHLKQFQEHLDPDPSVRSRSSPAGLFKQLMQLEPPNTYLKDASGSLAVVCESLEKSQGEGDEGLLKESVESLRDYIQAANCLVRRIEDAVDRYLFWDEEVQMYEAVNSSPIAEQFSGSLEDLGEVGDGGVDDMSETSGGSSAVTRLQSVADSGVKSMSTVAAMEGSSTSLSQKWAEATSQCQDAKDYLEIMCQDLSNELAQFDLLKEQEMKQILLAYCTNQLEVQEKSKSKWFSLKFILDVPIKPDVRAIQFKSEDVEGQHGPIE